MADDADVHNDAGNEKKNSTRQDTHWINKFLIFHGPNYVAPAHSQSLNGEHGGDGKSACMWRRRQQRRFIYRMCVRRCVIPAAHPTHFFPGK